MFNCKIYYYKIVLGCIRFFFFLKKKALLITRTVKHYTSNNTTSKSLGKNIVCTKPMKV